MNPYIDSSLQKIACAFADWLDKKKSETQDHVHYGCVWVIRGSKVFHICNEQKIEWEVK